MAPRMITYELKLKNIKHLLYGKQGYTELEQDIKYYPVGEEKLDNKEFLLRHLGPELLPGMETADRKCLADLMGSDLSEEPWRHGSKGIVKDFCDRMGEKDGSTNSYPNMDNLVERNRDLFTERDWKILAAILEDYLTFIRKAEADVYDRIPVQQLDALLRYVETCLAAYKRKKDTRYPAMALSWLLVGALVRTKMVELSDVLEDYREALGWTEAGAIDKGQIRELEEREAAGASAEYFSKSNYIITPLEGSAYVADYIRELLYDVFGSWEHIVLDYHSEYNLNTEILSNADYFYDYYKGNRNRNLSTVAFDQLRPLFSRLLIDAYKNDYEYTIELSKRLSYFFKESLCVQTNHLILNKNYEPATNKAKIMQWKNILFEVISYWRRCGEKFLLSDLQAYCDYYMSLAHRRNRLEAPFHDAIITPFHEKGSWEYTICIVDDDDEFRNNLRNMLNYEIKKNGLYDCKIIDFINGNTARVYTRETNCDVIILDLVNEKPYNLKDDPFNSSAIYFGSEYLDLILREKPDSIIATKFFIYSGVEKSVSRSEVLKFLKHHDIDISFYTKATFNESTQVKNHMIVSDIISYLNDLFYKDIMPNYLDSERLY